MRCNFRKVLPALLLPWALPCPAEPLYQGGAGDGADRSATIQIYLSNATAGTAALYRGGPADGHATDSAAFALSGEPLMVIYAGGVGDGSDRAVAFGSLSGQSLQILFLGGPGDGSDRAASSIPLSGDANILPAVYAGGVGDGSDAVLRAGSALEGTSFTGTFSGGPGDGADQGFASLALSGQSLVVLFFGGPGDGATVNTSSSSLLGVSQGILFAGGPGDGHDRDIATGIPFAVALLNDSDFDGVPDFWEMLFGLNPFDPTDAGLDGDHDGCTNLEEYIAGTDPTDPSSLFWAAVRLNNKGEPRVFFESSPDRFYTLELSPDLNIWIPTGPTTPGVGSEEERPVPAVEPETFLRIRATLP